MKLIKILDKQRQEAAEENKGTEENKNDITKYTEEQDERFEKYLAGQKWKQLILTILKAELLKYH